MKLSNCGFIEENLDTLCEEIYKADLNRLKAEKQWKEAENVLKPPKEDFPLLRLSFRNITRISKNDSERMRTG